RSLVASMRVACQAFVIRLSLGGHQPSADPTFDISNNIARRATEVGLVNELQNLASTKKTTQVHRQASKQINFRVSEPDYLKLARSAQTLNLSVPAFVKKKAQGARLVAPKIAAQDAQNITHQLAKIGGNLNQLAHHANQGSQIDPQALKDLQNEVQRVWQQLT
ncbi:MobC family plasmid mobilization relaxosome protein, partial [Lactiplantibacillus plantarum]